MACTVSGLHQGGVGATGGSREDHTSGLENRFNAQISHAAVGLTREEANGFVLEFLSHYEDTHRTNAPEGKPFREIYNTDTLEPTDEWLENYNTVSEAIGKTGLDINNRWKEIKKNFR